MSQAKAAPSVTPFCLDAWSQHHLREVEQALSDWVTDETPVGLDHGAPAALVAAMRYAVLDGGKRLRPLLVLAAYESVSALTQCNGRAAAVRAAAYPALPPPMMRKSKSVFMVFQIRRERAAASA